jgi:hypothetical protein
MEAVPSSSFTLAPAIAKIGASSSSLIVIDTVSLSRLPNEVVPSVKLTLKVSSTSKTPSSIISKVIFLVVSLGAKVMVPVEAV